MQFAGGAGKFRVKDNRETRVTSSSLDTLPRADGFLRLKVGVEKEKEDERGLEPSPSLSAG